MVWYRVTPRQVLVFTSDSQKNIARLPSVSEGFFFSSRHSLPIRWLGAEVPSFSSKSKLF